MKRSFLLILASLTLPLSAQAEQPKDCPSFTYDQTVALNQAYSYGLDHDYEYTLAAITWKESFVWKNIVKINPNDGRYGSYGITHILLETAMWLESEESSWTAKAIIAPKLIASNQYSFELSVKKLNSLGSIKWIDRVSRYNGSSKYGVDIANKVKTLRGCGFFSY